MTIVNSPPAYARSSWYWSRSAIRCVGPLSSVRSRARAPMRLSSSRDFTLVLHRGPVVAAAIISPVRRDRSGCAGIPLSLPAHLRSHRDGHPARRDAARRARAGLWRAAEPRLQISRRPAVARRDSRPGHRDAAIAICSRSRLQRRGRSRDHDALAARADTKYFLPAIAIAFIEEGFFRAFLLGGMRRDFGIRIALNR